MRTAQTYPSPFGGVGCCPGLGRTNLDNDLAVRVNRDLAKKYGWKIKPGGRLDRDFGEATLADEVYAFQHRHQKCAGELPDEFSSHIAECYNRDGMIGQRTLQQIFNVDKSDTATYDDLHLAEALEFPAGMKVQVAPDIACADLSAYGLSQRSDCSSGEGKVEIIKKHKQLGGESGGGAGIFIALGILALAGAGAYYYTRK